MCSRNNTYVQEQVTFTKAVVELAKERREIRSKRLMNQRNIALLFIENARNYVGEEGGEEACIGTLPDLL